MRLSFFISVACAVLLSACASTSYQGGALSEISSDDDFMKQVSVISWVSSSDLNARNSDGVLHPKQALKESGTLAMKECKLKGLEDPVYLRGSCYLESPGKYYCTEIFQCDASHSDAKNNKVASLMHIFSK